jgi:hypothetical protein
MKRITRLTVLLWTIGLSIIVASIFRANPHTTSSQLSIPPNETLLLFTGIWSPQKVWLQLTTEEQQKINLYVLDQNGLQQWEEQKILTPTISFENISQLSYRCTIPSRSKYTIIIQNSNNSTVNGGLDLTFYDFEPDLIAIAVASIFIGAVAIAAYHIKRLVNNRKATNTPS